MGLLANIWNWLGEQFTKLTDWLRQTVTEFLDGVREGIILITHAGKKWLAETMSTTWGFWLCIAIAVGAVIVAGQIKAAAWFILWRKSLEDGIAKLKIDVGTTLGWLNYTLLLEVHQLALILSPEYAKAWEPIYDGFAGIAEELRIGTGTINLMIRGAKQVTVATLLAIGVDPKSAALYADGEATAFLDKVEGRFVKYADDPYSIFSDIDQEIVWPSQAIMSDTFRSILGDISKNAGDITKWIRQVLSIEDALDSLVANLPEEFDAVVKPLWDDMTAEFDAIKETYIIPALVKTEEVVAELESFQAEITEKVEKFIALVANPSDYLLSLLNLSDEERIGSLETIQWVLDEIRRRALAQSVPFVEAITKNDEDMFNRLHVPLYTVEAETGARLSKITVKLQYQGAIAWDVGEY